MSGAEVDPAAARQGREEMAVLAPTELPFELPDDVADLGQFILEKTLEIVEPEDADRFADVAKLVTQYVQRRRRRFRELERIGAQAASSVD